MCVTHVSTADRGLNRRTRVRRRIDAVFDLIDTEGALVTTYPHVGQIWFTSWLHITHQLGLELQIRNRWGQEIGVRGKNIRK